MPAATLTLSDSVDAVDRDPDDDVAALAHQPGQARSLGADHQSHRVGEAVVLVQLDVAVGGQAHGLQPGVLVGSRGRGPG